MKRVLIFLIVLFPILLSASNEFTQTVKGTIIDKEAEYPLPGVNVVWVSENGLVGTSTDLDGRFELKDIPVGRQTFQFSFIGYKTITISNVLIVSAKELILDIELEEDLSTINEVVITDRKDKRKAVNEMAAVSARSISMEEITRFSGSTGDVARMAQNYAGVAGSADDRNDIIVRGNSPSTVLWRLEGVDIPSPNHWSTLGTTGGPVSMLNSNNLRTSDFLSGAFPSEYGNATGAVFDLKLRSGNPDKFEFLGQIGFNGFEGGIEGPLGITDRSSFLVNYRYSTLGVFNALGIDFGTGFAVPQYQDINFKVNIPTEKLGKFSFWGLAGISDILFEAELEEDNLFSEGDENLRAGARTAIVGLNHTYFFNENTSGKLALSYSAAESTANIEEIIVPGSDVFETTFDSNNTQEKIGLNYVINSKLNEKNRVKGGIMYDLYDLSVIDSVLITDNTWWRELDFEGSASLYRAYAQWQHKFNNKLTLNTGLHGMFFGLNESTSIEPRVNLSYEVGPRLTLSAGFGRHGQLQPLPAYFSKERFETEEVNALNEQLDFVQSNHYVLAADYLIAENTRLKTEVYYQQLFNLAVDPEDGDFSMVNFGAGFGFPNRAGLVNEGTGQNVGVELTLERFLNQGFYYLLTGSIFDSTYEGFDEVTRNTFYNSNYVFNALAGKEFNINDKFALTIDGKVTYAGGRRYTPIDLDASIAAGQEIRDDEQRFEAQFDPYFRPDLKIGFRQNGKGFSQTFSVDLQNFTNSRNEFSKSFNEESGEIRTTYQRGFFPDVRYQILF